MLESPTHTSSHSSASFCSYFVSFELRSRFFFRSFLVHIFTHNEQLSEQTSNRWTWGFPSDGLIVRDLLGVWAYISENERISRGRNAQWQMKNSHTEPAGHYTYRKDEKNFLHFPSFFSSFISNVNSRAGRDEEKLRKFSVFVSVAYGLWARLCNCDDIVFELRKLFHRASERVEKIIRNSFISRFCCNCSRSPITHRVPFWWSNREEFVFQSLQNSQKRKKIKCQEEKSKVNVNGEEGEKLKRWKFDEIFRKIIFDEW